MPKVKITEIKKKIGENFEVEGTITRKEKTLRGMYREHALCTLEDETGYILLNLWRDQINQVDVGDSVQLKSAYTKKYKGSYQLSTWEEKIQVLKRSKPQESKSLKLRVSLILNNSESQLSHMNEPKQLYPGLSLGDRILRLLDSKEEYGGPQSVDDICKNLQILNTNIRSAVIRLKQKGKIERISKGIYRIKGDARNYPENKKNYIN